MCIGAERLVWVTEDFGLLSHGNVAQSVSYWLPREAGGSPDSQQSPYHPLPPLRCVVWGALAEGEGESIVSPVLGWGSVTQPPQHHRHPSAISVVMMECHDKKQFRKGTVYLAHPSVLASSRKEVTEAGAGDSRSHHMHSQEQGMKCTVLPAC